jgi:hypothetical protein
MVRSNPQLSAIALLVRKFGTRIAGGGYEVEVSISEMMEMSPHGTFQEVPSLDQRVVKWQYFPNVTIDAEGHVVPDEPTFTDYAGDKNLDVTGKSLSYSDEKVEDDRPVRPDETVG